MSENNDSDEEDINSKFISIGPKKLPHLQQYNY